MTPKPDPAWAELSFEAATKPRAPRTALVTGATGFVGSFLIDRLLEEGWNVVALARGGEAQRRVCAALQNVSGDFGRPLTLHPRLRIITGDVRDPQMGLAEDDADVLGKQIHEVWHCAANFGAGASGENPFSVNVTGTRHLLAFAARCNQLRPVPFYHVSTAFAGDSRGGLTREAPPGQDGAGRNEYESSKREAERLVLRWRREHGYPAIIFRPSIILGHARTGRAAGFAAYYDFLRSLCLLMRLRQSRGRTDRCEPPFRVQTRADLQINFVTIDFVIDAMWALSRAARGDDTIFNLVNDTPVAAGAVIDIMCRSIGFTGLDLVEAGAFISRPMTRSERLFHGMIGFERPYLEHEVLFDNRRFRRVVPVTNLPAPCIDEPLLRRINRGYLDYCERQSMKVAAPRPAVLRPETLTSLPG